MSGAADANAAFTRGALGGCQGLCAAAAAYTTEDRAKTKKKTAFRIPVKHCRHTDAQHVVKKPAFFFFRIHCLHMPVGRGDVFSALNPQLKIINLGYIL